MRSDRYRKWRPLAGVVALGLFAFGWSLQGAAEEREQPTIRAGACATAVVNMSDELTPAATARSPGLSANRGIVESTTGTLTRGMPVVGDVPAFSATEFGEKSPGVAGRGRPDPGDPCICDLDCADGDPCTNDWCDISGKQIIGICVRDFDGTEDRDCDDGDVEGQDGYCQLGNCDGAGNCVAGEGGSPCPTDEVCYEDLDRCEDENCHNGQPCADDLFCNGTETCDEDNHCVSGPDPCPGAPCNENNPPDGNGTCGDPVTGRCCSGATGYETCAVNLLTECDAVPGLWGYGDDCALGCPPYSSGWAPSGDFLFDLTPIQNQPCEEYYRVGDDYTVANGSYMQMEQFRFIGGVDCVDDGRVLFEFWDGSEPPNKVYEIRIQFTCPADAGVHGWMINTGVAPVLPPTGYVTFMMREGSQEIGHWYSTDVVDVGNNNAQLLWANDVRGPHLSSWYDVEDVLAFELVGPDCEEPLFACCYDDGSCLNKLPWICAAEGGVSVADAVCEDDPYPCAAGACCITATGDCVLQPDPGTCSTAGGTWQGYGTDCDPNCCLQPVFTGGDDCDTATVHQIVVPPFGAPAVTVTISGNNSTVTTGVCDMSGTDPGWYEAFNLIDGAGEPAQCARVTVDKCCTDPEPGADYVVIIKGCSEANITCGASVFSDEYGWAPFCGDDDSNMWNLFYEIPGGTYHYPIMSDNTTYPGCLGDYQMHIKVEGCYENACCLPPTPPDVSGCPSQCVEMNRLACELVDGFFHAQVPICQYDPPTCEPGACCPEPGVCDDGGGGGVACEACMVIAGAMFYGGATCDDNPCRVCPWVIGGDPPISDPAFCVEDADGDYILYVDRSSASAGAPYPRWADDFFADSSGQVERICWWPCFYASGHGYECYEDPNGDGVNNDGWQVVFYADDNGLPGAVIGGPELVTPDAKTRRGAMSRCWEYSAALSAGPVLVEGECYWIEITGEGDQDACQVYWLTCGAGNRYSVFDQGGSWGPEDVEFVVGGGTASSPYSDCIDLTFCLDRGIGGRSGGCGIHPGACIICGEEGPECDGEANDHVLCKGDWGPTTDPHGVAFFPYDDCDNGICVNSPDPENPIPCDVSLQDCPGETGPCVFHLLPPAPANDTCVTSAMPIHDGGLDDPCPTLPCTFEFDNTCANTDGPDPECGTDFGSDIWYEFHAQDGECGNLYIDTCQGGTYDGIIAFYGTPCGVSGCPTDSTEMVSCGDDTCGVGAGMPCIGDDDPAHPFCPVVTDPIYICENETYLIRMAGWASEYGSGQMLISFVVDPAGCDVPPCSECGQAAVRPLAEDCRDIPPGTRCDAGKPDACVDDDDCAGESHCVLAPTDQPELDNVCYAPKTRYLSIVRNPDQVPYTERRVKLDDGTVLGWVDTPYEHLASGLWLAEVVDAPVLVQTWPDIVHVIGCEVAHASLSNVTEQHCQPNPIAGETCVEHCYIIQASSDGVVYSEELMLCTNSTWGDTCKSGPGGLLVAADGVPGLADIMAAIAYFQGDTTVAPLTWLDIAPSLGIGVPDQTVGLGDIMGAIAGFQGYPYPGFGPKGACP